MDKNDDKPTELTPRDPSVEDVVALCRELNAQNARYVVAGGFAIKAAGYARHTTDIDLLIEPSLENESKVYAALSTLPDGCVRELEPGDVSKYIVVRVADEILVDLMAKAGGIEYAEASQSVIIREIDGIAIPFASPELLWRMKRYTHRVKDQADLVFLRQLFEAEGKSPPAEGKSPPE